MSSHFFKFEIKPEQWPKLLACVQGDVIGRVRFTRNGFCYVQFASALDTTSADLSFAKPQEITEQVFAQENLTLSQADWTVFVGRAKDYQADAAALIEVWQPGLNFLNVFRKAEAQGKTQVVFDFSGRTVTTELANQELKQLNARAVQFPGIQTTVCVIPGPLLAAARSGQSNWVEDDLSCPLLQEVMRTPVVTPDGCVYEEKDIKRWLTGDGATGPEALKPHNTDPLTRSPLTVAGLTRLNNHHFFVAAEKQRALEAPAHGLATEVQAAAEYRERIPEGPQAPQSGLEAALALGNRNSVAEFLRLGEQLLTPQQFTNLLLDLPLEEGPPRPGTAEPRNPELLVVVRNPILQARLQARLNPRQLSEAVPFVFPPNEAGPNGAGAPAPASSEPQAHQGDVAETRQNPRWASPSSRIIGGTPSLPTWEGPPRFPFFLIGHGPILEPGLDTTLSSIPLPGPHWPSQRTVEPEERGWREGAAGSQPSGAAATPRTPTHQEVLEHLNGPRSAQIPGTEGLNPVTLPDLDTTLRPLPLPGPPQLPPQRTIVIFR